MERMFRRRPIHLTQVRPTPLLNLPLPLDNYESSFSTSLVPSTR